MISPGYTRCSLLSAANARDFLATTIPSVPRPEGIVAYECADPWAHRLVGTPKGHSFEACTPKGVLFIFESAARLMERDEIRTQSAFQMYRDRCYETHRETSDNARSAGHVE